MSTRTKAGLVPRRVPVGAEVTEGGVHFRVWAPARRTVEVVLPGRDGAPAIELAPEPDGHFAGLGPGVEPGARYWLRLDGARLCPDPASRFQPEGPHGPSEVVDPSRFPWTDEGWPGTSIEGQVLYELHVGTFTPEGTWAAATGALHSIADLGVTAVELLPVADFPGRFGWGYDGVCLYAPSRLYGTPDDFRSFVDRAHALGIAVLLDVVYNHLGPDGNFLKEFAPQYFTSRYATEWGEPINFDGADSGPVRAFFVENAAYWVAEFHLDGLRLDATQAMFDASPLHVVDAIKRRVREAGRGRGVLVIAENEPQDARLLAAVEAGGAGLDGLWNDDFHHAAVAAVTGRREAYYSDTPGTAQELVSCAKYGFLYQGQHYAWQGKRRGTPTRGVPIARFVNYLENHDQVANSAAGRRLHALTSPGRHRAITALLLLGPWTPMLFQGQEMNATAPFLYFADHHPGLAPAVRSGRAEFLRQFPSIAPPEMRDRLDDPGRRTTFERCKLDPAERTRSGAALALHRDLIELRRTDPTIALQGRHGIDGAVIAPETLCLRWFGASPDLDRLLVLNLGPDLDRASIAEPLVAPPARCAWRVVWASEEPRYGGLGVRAVEDDRGFHVSGHAAVLLAAAPSGRPSGGEPDRPAPEPQRGPEDA